MAYTKQNDPGFMVTDNTSLPSSQVDPGSSSSAPIELDDRKPTPLFNFTFKPTSLANRDSKPSTISLQKKKAPEAAHPKSSLKVETSKKKSKTTKPSSSLPKAKSALKAPTKSEPDKLLSKSVMRPKSAIKAVMKLKSTKSATKPKSTLKHRPTQSTESSKQDLSVTKKVIIRIESLDPDATKPTIKRQPVKDTKSKDKASSKRNPVSREKEKIVMPEPIAFIKRDSDTLDKKKQKRVKFNINDEKEVVLNTTGSKRGLERKKKKRYSAPEVVKRMFELFPQLKRPVGRPPSTFKIPHPVVLIKKQKPESAQLAQSTQKRKPEVISFVDDEDDDEDDYYTAKKQKLDTNSLQNVRVVIRKCQ